MNKILKQSFLNLVIMEFTKHCEYKSVDNTYLLLEDYYGSRCQYDEMSLKRALFLVEL